MPINIQLTLAAGDTLHVDGDTLRIDDEGQGSVTVSSGGGAVTEEMTVGEFQQLINNASDVRLV